MNKKRGGFSMKPFLSVILLLAWTQGCGSDSGKESDSELGQAPFLESPVWLRSTGTDQGLGLAIRANESLIMVGRTQGPLGQDDGFILSANSAGTTEWTTFIGSAGVDVLLDVGVHQSGVIFAGGVSTGDYDGQVNTLFSDGALSALSPGGDVLWSRLLGLGAINQVQVVSDGVVVSGSGIQAGRNDADAFVAKYDLAGTRIWLRWLRSAATDSATGLVEVGDEIWVTGFTDGALFSESSLGALNGFIAVLSSDGSLVRGTQVQEEHEQSYTRICKGSRGEVVVGGYSIDADGEIDSIVRAYDASHSALDGWRSDWGGADAVYGLLCKEDGEVVLSGRIDQVDTGDGFWVVLDEGLEVVEQRQSGFAGRDEWVDVTASQRGFCFTGYRSFDANPTIEDLDAVAECY